MMCWWAQRLPEKQYQAIYQQLTEKGAYTILAYMHQNNGAKVAYTCSSLPALRNNEFFDIIDTTGGSNFSDCKAPRNKKVYTNGFFCGAGLYKSNKIYTNAQEYIAFYQKTGKLVKDPCGSEQMRAYVNGLSEAVKEGLVIARLQDATTTTEHAEDAVHYTGYTNTADFLNKVKSGEIEKTNSGTSTGTGIGTVSTPDTTYDVTQSTSSIGQIPYVTDLNNYTLKFVPCKDSRADKTNLKYKIVNSNCTQSETEAGNKYYIGYNNTIYALIDNSRLEEDTEDTTATVTASESRVEPMSVLITQDVEASNLFSAIDNCLKLQKENDYLWSANGENFPTAGIKLDTEFGTYGLIASRLPKLGYVIVPKNKKYSIIDKKTLKEAAKNGLSFTKYLEIDKATEKAKYEMLFYEISLDETKFENNKLRSGVKAEDAIRISQSDNDSFSVFLEGFNSAYKAATRVDYTIDVSLSQERKSLNIYDFQLFEAYTRGHDFIQEDYTTVRPAEKDPTNLSETSRLMDFEDNYFTYKYTGRDIDIFNHKDKTSCASFSNGVYCGLIHEKDLLLEDDITLGEAYEYNQYFIQAIKYPELDANGNKTTKDLYTDTFKVTDLVKEVDDTKYVEEDIEVLTGNIDLLQCKYYDATQATAANKWCDCCYGGKYDKECIYQKTGVCPYRFVSEKHPRRIRTLEQSKSNRFNLIQELSKVFEYYPYFYIEYDRNGKVLLDENGRQKKHVTFITEKGSDKYAGFRYEKNLSGINRTIDSSSITTKLYVESVDSELEADGVCSIQTAIDNLGKNSYILDFSYYTDKNLLNAEQVQRDVYGIEKGDMAFLPTIGKYNDTYDKYSNLIINLTGEELTTLKAEIDVAVTGITTALEERKKVGQTMYKFKEKVSSYTKSGGTITKTTTTKKYKTSDSYVAYVRKYREQATILWGLVEQLFFSNGYFNYITIDSEDKYIMTNINIDDATTYSNTAAAEMINRYKDKYCKGELFWRLMLEGFGTEEEKENYEPPFTNWNTFKDKIVEKDLYEINGQLGQYHSLMGQVKYWKTERAKLLNKINDISEQFYKKYEPFIKEGTFTDSNYLTDNEYYWAAVSVLEDSCKPNVSYDISVIDISPLEEYADDYTFELADTTYLEDIDFFGANYKTGLPNRQKVLISAIEYSLDQPQNNSITIQNYTTQFEDLFSSIQASVQSLTFNENTYKRSSNFTAKQYIETDSLQGTLDGGDLTLINANDQNIVVDDSGTQGNGISNNSSQYKQTGEGLYFSTDGGQTWDIGVGPKGLNADYIKFGQLDASKVQIVDGEYIYFLWDKNGLNAYRDPSTSTNGLVDFARFNKYGLSLIENNNVRLRAGYEYRSNDLGDNETGDYSQELPLTNQDVGFYLYNDKGQPIFQTETQSSYNAESNQDFSARLSLKGEIFVTNRNLAGDNNGSVISTKTAKKLSVGYKLEKKNAIRKIESNVAKGKANNLGADTAQNCNWFFMTEDGPEHTMIISNTYVVLYKIQELNTQQINANYVISQSNRLTVSDEYVNKNFKKY